MFSLLATLLILSVCTIDDCVMVLSKQCCSVYNACNVVVTRVSHDLHP